MDKYNSNFKGNYIEEKVDLELKGKSIGDVSVGYYGPFSYSDRELKFINSFHYALIIIAIIAIIATIFALLLGTFIASFLTKPIVIISSVAKKIANRDFSSKIDISSTTVEIYALINDINELASKLEKLDFLRKQFSSDIAHELRTPIAILQANIEAMLDGIMDAEPSRLINCLEDTKRIGRLVDELEDSFEFEDASFFLKKK